MKIYNKNNVCTILQEIFRPDLWIETVPKQPVTVWSWSSRKTVSTFPRDWWGSCWLPELVLACVVMIMLVLIVFDNVWFSRRQSSSVVQWSVISWLVMLLWSLHCLLSSSSSYQWLLPSNNLFSHVIWRQPAHLKHEKLWRHWAFTVVSPVVMAGEECCCCCCCWCSECCEVLWWTEMIRVKSRVSR